MTQTCNLADGIEIEFPNRGTIIRPYEVSTRAQRHKFSYASAKVSIQAAELISDKQAYNEPVLLKIGGITHHRYFIPSGGITYGEQQAWIELLDPLKILEEETIEESYDSTTLEDIVRDLFNARNDPNNLLTGYEIVNANVAKEYSETLNGQLKRWGVPRPLAWVWAHLSRTGAYFDGSEIEEGGFFFDEETLYEALLQVEEEYGVISWVDPNGRLCIGFPELRSTNAIPVYGDPRRDRVSISAYNVGTSRNSLVYLEGRSTPFSFLNGRVNPNTRDENAAYFVAEAELPGREGNHGSLKDPIRARNQEELEAIIQRKFVDAHMDHNSGNIEFNGISSEDKESLARLNVGDMIGVAPERDQVCGRGVEGGEFIVNQVQNNVNPRVGWQITASVSRVPDPPTINSWIYDPRTGESFRDITEFAERED